MSKGILHTSRKGYSSGIAAISAGFEIIEDVATKSKPEITKGMVSGIKAASNLLQAGEAKSEETLKLTRFEVAFNNGENVVLDSREKFEFVIESLTEMKEIKGLSDSHKERIDNVISYYLEEMVAFAEKQKQNQQKA